MQAAVDVNDVRLLADDPLVEVLQHVGAIAAVGLVADDDGLAFEPLGHQRRVAHADRVADEDDLRQIGGFLRRFRLAGGERREQEEDAEGSENTAAHGSISYGVRRGQRACTLPRKAAPRQAL